MKTEQTYDYRDISNTMKYRIIPQAHTFGGQDIPKGYPDEMYEMADKMDVPRDEIMGMMDGYTYDDYFTCGCAEDDYYESEADANAAYKGDDQYGIGVRYDVETVEVESLLDQESLNQRRDAVYSNDNH